MRTASSGPLLRHLRLVFLLLAAGPPAALAAQEMAVPIAVQLPLFVKILTFDRNRVAQPGGPIVMGVLYQSKFRASANVADEIRRTAGRLSGAGNGAVLRVIALDLDDTSDLESALSRLQLTVLYVSPLRAVDLESVAAATRKARILTLTGVPRYVAAGLSIGIDLKGERPDIVINLPAAKAEGADLDAQLLKLARVIQ